jgi:phosphoglycerate dehydrogenase-like enzyme
MVREILVLLPVKDSHQDKLTRAFPQARCTFRTLKTVTQEDVIPADVIIGNPPVEFLRRAAGLQLLQLMSVGAEPYLALEQLQPQAKLCCASGVYGTAISEHMLAMLLYLMKKLPQYHLDQAQGKWLNRGQAASVYGANVLIIGLGDIGSAFARLCGAMGARVTGIRRTVTVKPDFVDALYTLNELDRLLPEADVVSLSVPETPDTLMLMDKQRIDRMKRGAFLLNVGRGTAIDQEALIEALKTGRLGGAGLDVTTPEPLPADHPLRQAENILITPHISGWNHTNMMMDILIDIACRNISAVQNGTPLTSPVNYHAGY